MNTRSRASIATAHYTQKINGALIARRLLTSHPIR
jgi:hypothetical protein